jgi:tripartite-type tricarboxylate transporter receptor subunit TctC
MSTSFVSRASRLFAVLVLTAAAGLAQAQAWPEKNITIVVPTAPGGANDAIARILAQALAPKLGKSVIVDNRAGGSGTIASEYVAHAAPDGYTIDFGYIATHGINPALQKLRYDPVNDFEPIGMVAISPTLLVSNPHLPVKNATELVALLKKEPGKYSYASAGTGSAPHLAGELFKLKTGVQVVHVPYKGSGPGLLDTIAGNTQLMFPSLFSAFPHVKAGQLRALALVGEKRSPAMPDLPTLAEQGIKDVTMTQWYALFFPAKTPRPIVDRLNRELKAVLAEPDTIKRIEAQGGEVETSTPEQLKDHVKQELARWKGVAAAAKITVD